MNKQVAVGEVTERAQKLSEALAALSAENQRLAKKRGVKDYVVPANASEVSVILNTSRCCCMNVHGCVCVFV